MLLWATWELINWKFRNSFFLLFVRLQLCRNVEPASFVLVYLHSLDFAAWNEECQEINNNKKVKTQTLKIECKQPIAHKKPSGKKYNRKSIKHVLALHPQTAGWSSKQRSGQRFQRHFDLLNLIRKSRPEDKLNSGVYSMWRIIGPGETDSWFLPLRRPTGIVPHPPLCFII